MSFYRTAAVPIAQLHNFVMLIIVTGAAAFMLLCDCCHYL